MPEFLTSTFKAMPPLSIAAILIRLVGAVLLGALVAWIYRRARGAAAQSTSFPGTLVLLCVLIAMVTQVIGDNVARAFSLVGALSIVRFRTVVRDTQDTAYVIFAVVVGMAVGAQDLWVAASGVVIVGLAAFFLCRSSAVAATAHDWLLNLRVSIGADASALLSQVKEPHIATHQFVSAETARQGISLDVAFNLSLQPAARPDALVQALNRIEGVQGVSLRRRDVETND